MVHAKPNVGQAAMLAGLVVMVALSGCSAGPGSAPEETPPGTEPGSETEAAEVPPIVLEGKVSGVLDCVVEDPQTPVVLDLPEEAGGRRFTLDVTGPAETPQAGAVCLRFDDGDIMNSEEAIEGRVPAEAKQAILLASLTVESDYVLTIT